MGTLELSKGFMDASENLKIFIVTDYKARGDLGSVN